MVLFGDFYTACEVLLVWVAHGQWDVSRHVGTRKCVLEGKGNAFLHSSLLSAGSVVDVWAAMPTAILEHELEVTDGGTTYWGL